MTIRLLVADDQPLVRAGLRKIFESDASLRVVADVADGLAAVHASRRLKPDVVVIDIRMPHLDGLEATRRIVSQDPAIRVMVLTTFDLDEYVFGALRAGASGFLLKDVEAEQLIAGVHVVARGDALLDPAVTRTVVEAFSAVPVPDPATSARIAALSPREHEVLLQLVEGHSNKRIAERLFVSETTVKSHVLAVLRKLGLRDRVHAVIFCYENGVVRPGDGRPATDERPG